MVRVTSAASEPEFTPPQIIRKSDYYGGDLHIEPNDVYGNYGSRIVWEAWGGYGSAEITLNVDETKKVAEALMKVYAEAPEWVYKEAS